MKNQFAILALIGAINVNAVQVNEYPQPDIRGPMPRNAHPDSTFSSHVHNDWTQLQLNEYPQPDIRGPMPRNAHPDSTFSSHVHNDWTQLQTGEYPQPDIRGPMPRNAHPDSTFSSHLHNDWTQLQTGEYPQPDIRGPMPRNAHPDSTFSSHLHNDWTQAQIDSESDSDSDSDSDDENVQTGDFEHFVAGYHGAGAQGGYERVIPDRFTFENDDTLMRSLIDQYALEMKTEDGRPSGHFFFDKNSALAVSKEVVNTHFFPGEPAKGNNFIAENFDNTWTHFDVNKDNLVEVERMPQFLRYFLGNSLQIGLQ